MTTPECLRLSHTTACLLLQHLGQPLLIGPRGTALRGLYLYSQLMEGDGGPDGAGYCANTALKSLILKAPAASLLLSALLLT